MATIRLMFQGTGLSPWTSLFIAAFCRTLANKGFRACVFKPVAYPQSTLQTQNDIEVDRLIELYALAGRTTPTADMNPIVYAPSSERNPPCLIFGQRSLPQKSHNTEALLQQHSEILAEAFQRLSTTFDAIIVEGNTVAKDSCAVFEDPLSIRFAEQFDLPVVLVADHAQREAFLTLIGTKLFASSRVEALIKGYTIQRYPQEPEPHVRQSPILSKLTSWRNYGIVPNPEKVDTAFLEHTYFVSRRRHEQRRCVIAILEFPHLSNRDDFTPLDHEEDIQVVWVGEGKAIPQPCDLVILPGSKATIMDLHYLRQQGWDIDLHAHRRQGQYILGICGGYQMLGKVIQDPYHIEGGESVIEGLNFLEIETFVSPTKNLKSVTGKTIQDDLPFKGYLMHMGKTVGNDTQRPFLKSNEGQYDGAMSADGHVIGTYAHALFGSIHQRAGWINKLRNGPGPEHQEKKINLILEQMSHILEPYLNTEALIELGKRAPNTL